MPIPAQPLPPRAHLALAVECHRQGQLQEAEPLYARAIADDPGDAHAHYLYGSLLLNTQRPKQAAALARAALERDASRKHYPCLLGHALARLDQADDALDAYDAALALDPDYREVLERAAPLALKCGDATRAHAYTTRLCRGEAPTFDHLLLHGQILLQARDLPAAHDVFQRALALNDADPRAHAALGRIFIEQGKFDFAVGAFTSVTERDPSNVEGFLSLGVACIKARKQDQARVALRRAHTLDRSNPAPLYHLGRLAAGASDHTAAIGFYHRVLTLDSEHTKTLVALGQSLVDTKRFEQAEEVLRRALQIDPDTPEAYLQLGNSYRERKQFDQAVEAFERAHELRPSDIEPLHALIYTEHKRHRPDRSLTFCKKLADLAPDTTTTLLAFANTFTEFGQPARARPYFLKAYKHPTNATSESGFLFNLNYVETETDASLSDHHRRWNDRFARPIEVFEPTFPNDPDPNRPLRVGYISPDFGLHPVGYFFSTLFFHHDRHNYQPYLYSHTLRPPDEVTLKLRDAATRFVEVQDLSHERIAEIIREDKIDILIDLAGHSCGNDMCLFPRRPAPVTAHWLGYIHTTLGMTSVDYRITDAIANPPEEERDRAWCPETLVRLPESHHCYHPPYDYPDVAPLPAERNGLITFGSCNNLCKASDLALDTWARILRAVPNSRLLLKHSLLDAEVVRERLIQFFAERGVSRDRLDLLAFVNTNVGHIGTYHQIDIALDPFPYNGATSTCEALLMGCPVVALRGWRHSARMAASILTNVGLPDWIADTTEDYIRLAAAKAADLAALAKLRAGLREQFNASPVGDAPRFARSFEQGLRAMWQHYCRRFGSFDLDAFLSDFDRARPEIITRRTQPRPLFQL